jgi:NAD(P)-dependent dehydrogenase (short-subunit alcohol dehydrogenase family)
MEHSANRGTYAAAKARVIGPTLELAREVAPKATVNAIGPGSVLHTRTIKPDRIDRYPMQ